MNAQLQEKCEQVVRNHELLYKKMIWEAGSNDVAIMASFILASMGIDADPDRYTECKKILKNNVNIFSEFRGIGEAMVITKMTLKDDPEAYLKGCLEVYKKLRDIHKLTASPYMVMAAITIYEKGGLEHADENIAKLEELYKEERAIHPLLINDMDRGYLSMIITHCSDHRTVSAEIERCYDQAKDLSWIDKDAIHSMAQVMSLSDKPAEQKVELVRALLDGLKVAKHPASKTYGLPALAAFSLLDMSPETIVPEIAEAADYLKQQKGFKWYSVDARTRVMYASLLVFMAHVGVDDMSLAGSISSTLAMVLVEQLIMLLIIVSVSASRAAASSSSN